MLGARDGGDSEAGTRDGDGQFLVVWVLKTHLHCLLLLFGVSLAATHLHFIPRIIAAPDNYFCEHIIPTFAYI